MPATYEPISTTTLSSATTSINFTSIPATYTDLRIVWVYQTTTGGSYPIINFNSDAASNYSYITLFGAGSSSGASQYSTNNNTAYLISNVAAPTSKWSMSTIDIFSYAGSTFKTLLNTTVGDATSSGNISVGGNLWRSTSAITAIQVKFDSLANMIAGSTATLYGIKAA